MIIAMKKFVEVSAVVAWDREGYIKEPQKQLKDDNELFDKSNYFLQGTWEKLTIHYR